MSQELLYTSAPRGLKPGSRGFCTVLSTQGMPAPLASTVEGLSAYRPVYPSSDERAARNPIVYSHLKMQATGRTWHVLSRIADYGLDYSQRANKLAHHVILDNSNEQLPGGPANLLSMPGFMRDAWEGEPKVVALKPVTRESRSPSGICQQWKAVTGDAGWAGVVAESFLRDPERLVILLFDPGQEILPLFAESLSLLPPEKRWDVTFSTYFTGLATGTTCVWRALVYGSKEAHDSLRFVNALRIDLTQESLGTANGDELVEAARTGNRANPDNGTKTASPLIRNASTLPEHSCPAEFEQHDANYSDATPRFSQMPIPRELVAPPTIPTLPMTPRNPYLEDTHHEDSKPAFSLRGLWRQLAAVASLLALCSCVYFFQRSHSRPTEQATVSENEHALVEKGEPTKSKDSSEQPTQKPVSIPIAVTAIDTTAIAAIPQTTSIATDKTQTGVKQEPAKPEPKTTAPTLDAAVSGRPDSGGQTSSTIARKVLKIPDVGEDKLEFHSFRREKETQLPDIRLLKPSWLPYVDGRPKYDADKTVVGVIKDKSGTDEIEVAHITLNLDNDSVGHYKIKSLKPIASLLGWYGLELRFPDAQNAAFKRVFFSDFPINVANNCQFEPNKLSIRWELPPTAPVESRLDANNTPIFSLERFLVRVGDVTAPADIGDSTPRSRWECNCERVANIALAKRGLKTNASQQLKIEIIVDKVKNPRSAVEFPIFLLTLKGRKEFLDDARDNAKSSLLLITSAIGDNEQKRVKVALDRAFSSSSEKTMIDSALNEIVEIGKSIDERFTKESEGKIKADLANHKKAIDDLISQLDTVKRFHSVTKSISTMSIASARIYYQLVVTKQKNVSIEVDVVNFDDSKPEDLKANESVEQSRAKQ